MKKFLTKTGGVWLLAGVCCLLWGSAFPAIKIGYRLFEIPAEDTASIILFAGIRFMLAGALTIIIFSAAERKLLIPSSKGSLGRIGVLALFQTVIQYVFFYLGLAFTSGARGSVINASSVFFALIISSFIFKSERFKVQRLIGCVIGFAGVVLISLDSLKGSLGFTGEIFILISAVSYAFSSNFIKKYSAYDNPAMLSGWQFLLGGTVMTAAALIFGGRLNVISFKGVCLLGYLALVSAVAYSLWSILLKYNDVSKVAVCGFMIPVFGFFLSALVEKTEVGILSVAALVLAVFGIVVVNYNKSNKIN